MSNPSHIHLEAAKRVLREAANCGSNLLLKQNMRQQGNSSSNVDEKNHGKSMIYFIKVIYFVFSVKGVFLPANTKTEPHPPKNGIWNLEVFLSVIFEAGPRVIRELAVSLSFKSFFQLQLQELAFFSFAFSHRVNKSREYPWEIYTLKKLLHATNNFHNDNKIGEGGFGRVYCGRTSEGVEIAVKRLKAISVKVETEFAVEVEILGRVRHKNLLGLRGFYVGGDERLIVYDYMPNHSLITHLHGQLAADCLLDWPRRLRIAIGSAEGLAYLHHEVKPHIIHRDIKASNVLLDTNFEAKVADFGFAKLIPDGVTHMTTRVKGTLGYLAPEYAMWGKVSKSCDVYSFGILLLEIVSAKKPLEKLPGGVKRDIVQWVTPFVQKGAYDHIADPRLKGKFDRAQLKSAVAIALRCTDSNPDNRPSMLEVVEWLKGGVRRRRKSVTKIEDMVEKEDGDNDETFYDFEGFRMAQSDLRRKRARSKKI
ncbi:PTI1-like tyrosine-protein kinase At3g15890 [Durio zibethinus]|uniref:PTI1-like tyrosine-protein kinase At3g15890 n=1 Tax=Durio zibethinus TaxID=66656 RepID=A0A6P5YA13_DURZI|nr:PTI1-like tyrosine-protein kinase At3g15890 [Durio zibethinus]